SGTAAGRAPSAVRSRGRSRATARPRAPPAGLAWAQPRSPRLPFGGNDTTATSRRTDARAAKPQSRARSADGGVRAFPVVGSAAPRIPPQRLDRTIGAVSVQLEAETAFAELRPPLDEAAALLEAD